MQFAEIIIPQRLASCLTWHIPKEWQDFVRVGSVVSVDLNGKSRIGVVRKMTTEKPSFPTKPILGYEDTNAISILPHQLHFWEWIASYYMCSLGEVMQYALPQFLYPKQKAYKAVKKSIQHEQLHTLSLEEEKVMQLLIHYKSLTKAQLSRKMNKEDSSTLVDKLLEKGFCTEAHQRKPSRRGKKADSEASLSQFDLSSAQKNAQHEIDQLFYHQQKNIVLLHGITGSGKTNIYIHYIREELNKGNQILFLLPEIGLAEQMAQRLKKYVGEKLSVYHSKVAHGEAKNVWNLIHDKEPHIVVGTMSAIFLPFTTLSFVICDEEHDTSYKQQNAPKYNAKEASLVLAQLSKAKVLLGSATPCLETYYHAVHTQKYGYVSLSTRYSDIPLPEVMVFDMNSYLGKNKPEVWISPPVQKAIANCIANHQQVLIFQNRRGYAPYAICSSCKHIPTCTSCNVRLTFHKTKNVFVCHYCNAIYSIHHCNHCLKKNTLILKKAGTERIKEAIEATFPKQDIQIIDRDTNKKKMMHLIDQYENHQLSLLLGTQLITKGFDFEYVKLVVIPDFDGLLQFNYFRNNERLLQQIEQVGGRAGRKHEQGTVWIQTHHPEHPIISYLQSHQYTDFAEAELAVRKQFHYPPYAKMIYINCKSRKALLAEQASSTIAEQLRKHTMGMTIQGPIKPPIHKIKNEYIFQIMIKCSNTYAHYLHQKKVIQDMLTMELNRYVRVDIDVDPM